MKALFNPVIPTYMTSNTEEHTEKHNFELKRRVPLSHVDVFVHYTPPNIKVLPLAYGFHCKIGSTLSLGLSPLLFCSQCLQLLFEYVYFFLYIS